MKTARLNNCVFKGNRRESQRTTLVETASQFSYVYIVRKIGCLLGKPGTSEVPGELLLCIHHLPKKMLVTGSKRCESQEFSSGL